MNLEACSKFVQEKNIEFFLCSFVEMNGTPKAKVVPVSHLADMAKSGAGFAGFAAGEMGQGPHSPDMMAIPDFNSLTILPWRQNIAWVPGNIFVEDKPHVYCPRTILQGNLDKAKALGFTLKTGVEPEFFLVKKNGTGFLPGDDMDTLGKPCYDLRALNRNLDVMTRLIKHMQFLGWGPYANDHEDANCQFEINWEYADALTTADRLTFFKWMVRAVVEETGQVATFMPKPFTHLTGNGCHHHISLWDETGETNLFADKSDANGLSAVAYAFIGGLKAHAKGLAALIAPTVNSYKRLVRSATRSGATWAPISISYGGSNRTQMIRIPGPGRLEVRAVDGAANPYLAAAAILAAGLDGIERGLEAGPRNDDNLYSMSAGELSDRGIELLPQNLAEAIDEFEKDDVLKTALGEEYSENYIAVKRDEWRRYHESVGAWEIENYLGVY